VFPFGPGKLAPPVGLLLGGEQLDILAQRALIAFEGEDMIFSPESLPQLCQAASLAALPALISPKASWCTSPGACRSLR
jgi:hypothetical protein